MHYYQHNIKTWKAQTAHLTLLEDLAYRRITELYYDEDGDIPREESAIARLIRMPENEAEIQAVLSEFFELKNDVWRHSFCDNKISGYKKLSKDGKKGAEIKKQKQILAQGALFDPELTLQATTNHKPITNNQEIEESISLGFEEFWELFPRERRGGKEKASSAYAKALTRSSKEEINEGLIRYAASDEVARGFAKGAAAWLNDDRWTTNYKPAPPAYSGPAARKPTNYERALLAGVSDIGK